MDGKEPLKLLIHGHQIKNICHNLLQSLLELSF